MSAPARVRPRLHFTAQRGWTNDPHGIVHVDGKYHMFFQYNPAGVSWSPHCHWGHAVSHDLITWEEVDIALSPEGREIGCWSGSVVVDERGPAIVYTRIAGNDWGKGQVALARPRGDMSGWVRSPAGPVIAGPPGDLDIIAFRDPQVRREGGAWKAVVGGGLAGYGGCALQYSSPDLEDWTFDGVLASRSSAEREPVWTGTAWECPQLLQIGEDWVMLISVWAGGLPHNVCYALGDYDGKATFTARQYGRVTHGTELYATTTFQDDEGRPCAMSWLRERGNVPPDGSPWCSAMSLPHVLSMMGDRLIVSQHPALERALPATAAVGDVQAGGHMVAAVPGTVWRLKLRVSGRDSGGFGVSVVGNRRSFEVNLAGGSLVVVEGKAALLSMPAPSADDTEVDIVVDADIIEITVSGTEGIGATRVPVIGSGDIHISSQGAASITAWTS